MPETPNFGDEAPIDIATIPLLCATRAAGPP